MGRDKHLVLNRLSIKSTLAPHILRGGYFPLILSCSACEIRSGGRRAVVPACEDPVYIQSSADAISGAAITLRSSHRGIRGASVEIVGDRPAASRIACHIVASPPQTRKAFATLWQTPQNEKRPLLRQNLHPQPCLSSPSLQTPIAKIVVMPDTHPVMARSAATRQSDSFMHLDCFTLFAMTSTGGYARKGTVNGFADDKHTGHPLPSSYICTVNKKGVNLRDKMKKELNNKKENRKYSTEEREGAGLISSWVQRYRSQSKSLSLYCCNLEQFFRPIRACISGLIRYKQSSSVYLKLIWS
ncbi:MAG: hypothetical protein LBF05_06135 [Tannerella sp.]|nr:hypothetical protein [Tannerella sp.]